MNLDDIPIGNLANFFSYVFNPVFPVILPRKIETTSLMTVANAIHRQACSGAVEPVTCGNRLSLT